METLKDWYIQLASAQPWDSLFLAGLLGAELVLGVVIIDRVPYTEIDWEAYMQEVSMWVDDGIYDYRQIYGGTGPLVYPAGFLYLFAALRWITKQGTNVRLAQYIFLGFYLMLQALVLLIYTQASRFLAQSLLSGSSSGDRQKQLQSAHSVWTWRIAMGMLCCSKRLHSIFLLRLFNEGPTMILLYLCIYLLINNHWNSGCCAFSYAVSIKMNVLLFAPGLLLLLIQQARGNLLLVVRRLLLCCALPQLVLGAPFLLTYPESYIRKAFELDRVFFFKWTVNWKVRYKE
jgi:alpha-1,3-mannosyltransferase